MFNHVLFLEQFERELLWITSLAVVGVLVFAAMLDGKIPGLRFRASPKQEAAFWTGTEVIFALIFYQIAMVIGGALFMTLAAAIQGKAVDDPTIRTSPWVLLPATLFAAAAVLVFIRYIVRDRSGQRWRVLGFQRGDPRNLIPCVISYLLWLAPIFFLAFVVRVWLEAFAGGFSIQTPVESFFTAIDERNYGLLVALTISAVVVAPVVEEVLFRGFFYSWLRPRAGATTTIIVTAAVFSLYHMTLYSIVPLFVVGVLLGWVYERTRSLVFPIAWHAIFNGGSVAMFFLGMGR